MKNLWLPVWVAPRLLGALAIDAVLFSAAGALGYLFFIAVAGLVAIALLTVLDAITGPGADALDVERVALEHFALRVPGHLHYRITNRSKMPVSFGLFETTVEPLAYEVDEVTGTVPARSSAEVERPVTPLKRGEVRFGKVYLWYENRIGFLRRRRRICDRRRTACICCWFDSTGKCAADRDM